MSYINKEGIYYIGDRQENDLEVPDRPSINHEWINDEWIINSEKYIKTISDAVQIILDTEAQIAGYDSIHTAVTYADETAVAKFSDDGKSFRKWRSNVWAYCYGVLAQYETDLASDPSTVAPTSDGMIAGMPARV